MSKAKYEAMTREELRDYLKSDRHNDEAWEVFFQKNSEVEGKVTFPYTESMEETEAQLKSILESKTQA
jgi:hypothetical protein